MDAAGEEAVKAMSLFACFNADGPYWDNIVRTVAYPSGVSYFRPFRYRENWIQPSLLPIVTTPERHHELLGRPGYLAMSFSDPQHQRLFIPFREIRITHINPAPDSYAVFFTLGSFLDMTSVESLADRAETKPDDIEADCLFFEAGVDVGADQVGEDDEDAAWIRFLEILPGSAQNLPIKESALRSQYLRVRRPTVSGKPLVPEVLYTSTNAGPSHGYVLNEGSRSEFAYLHRLPSLIGTELAAGRYHIRHLTESGNIELDRVQEEITGRYQPHFFTVTAKKPTGTYEELVLASDVKEIVAEDDTTLLTLDVPIPMKVKWYWLHRTRTRLLPLFALVVAFVLANLGSYYYERQDNPQLPSLSGTAIVVRVVANAILAFVIWSVQQRQPKG
jgi:hypothetical protein